MLDTNVLSEVRRPVPSPRVLHWLAGLDEDRTFISVISIAEIRRGICMLDAGRKREELSAWPAHDLPQRFLGRILGIDESIALAWGDVMSTAQRRGLPLSLMDGWIAATTLVHDLALATRNTKDFQGLVDRLIDPWAS